MRVLEFKDYCAKLVLRNYILTGIVFILLVALGVALTKPKVAVVPGNRYLLFALLKLNYTPEDYPKTYLSWEFVGPLQELEKKKNVETVKKERIYSYFRPTRIKRLQEEGYLVCGHRVIFTDSPFRRIREGVFCVKLKNVEGKVYIEESFWKGEK